MRSGMLLHPPDIFEFDAPVIFLAGPIQGAPDWQSEATKIIHSINDDILVASPRKNYEPGEFVYEKQVDWETYFLKRAADFVAILFWLAVQAEETPGRSYAETTRFELGEWKARLETGSLNNLVVGIEEGFGNDGYIRRRFGQDCPGVPVLDNLDETCRAAVHSLTVKQT